LETTQKALEIATRTMENSRSTANNTTRSIKLPQLTIKPFSGQYDEWMCFRDLFNRTIGEATDLSDAQKLQYLKSLVTGPAEKLLRGVTVSEANFKPAWEKLVARYECENTIITQLLANCSNVPKMTNETPQAYRQLADELDGNLRTLEAVNEYARGREPWVINEFLSKCSASAREGWARHLKDTENKEPTGEQLLGFLNTTAQIKETAVTKTDVKDKKAHQGGTYAVTSSSEGDIKCPSCDGAHSLYNCNTFLGKNLEERKTLAFAKRLCLNCLRPGHRQNVCTSGSCRICQKKHNTLLHEFTTNSTNSETESRVTSDNAEQLSQSVAAFAYQMSQE
jgi:hypothetical protein